jgi:thiol-disulfide isomerase/thioredoxin
MKHTNSLVSFVATVSLIAIASLACAAEPNQKVPASDEDIYGKYAIGPKTPTPLDQAVATINEKIKGYSLKKAGQTGDAKPPRPALPPLSVDDVIAVIRDWDRDKTPVAEASFRIYEQIANTKILPPHSMLELNDQWFERGTQEHRLLQIKLTAMTGKNQGDEFVVREHELDRRPYFKPHPGFRWLSRPAPKDPIHGWTNWFNSQLRVSFDENDTKALVIEINRSNDTVSCQVVGFDENQNQYDFDCHVVGAYNGFVRERYRLNYADLPREKIEFVGIEAVTREDLIRLSSAASARFKEQDVKLLPLPKVGQSYDFSLTAAGNQIESSQLRGKVVLIDFWASWCVPCLKKMPELKDLYAKWHDQGLEVIGISFDDDAEAAQAIIDGMKLPWPSAILKSDSEVRKLWEQRDRVTRLPTVLVIDSEGILQFELFSDSGKVEEKIVGLISRAKSSATKSEGK